MNKSTRTILALALGTFLVGGLLWYLFLKPFDYLVSFDAKTLPGTVEQTLKSWATNLESTESILKIESGGILVQQLKFADSTHTYRWELTAINDSLTKVKVYVTDTVNSLRNKLTIPFGETAFEKRTARTVTDFVERMNEHLKSFSVIVTDSAYLAPSFCAYISLECTQLGKAGEMMRNYPILDGFLVRNNIKPAGSPFIRITKWDRTNDSIAFEFCRPIVKRDSLPASPLIKYRHFEGTEGLRAVYHGNYITSDRAWYVLLAYAKEQEIEILESPIEVFHSNPNYGGNELEWEAEIFMPLK